MRTNSKVRSKNYLTRNIVLSSIIFTLIVLGLLAVGSLLINKHRSDLIRTQDANALTVLSKRYGQSFKINSSRLNYIFFGLQNYQASISPANNPNVVFSFEKSFDPDKNKVSYPYIENYLSSYWNDEVDSQLNTALKTDYSSDVPTFKSTVTLDGELYSSYDLGTTLNLENALKQYGQHIGIYLDLTDKNVSSSPYTQEKSDYIAIYNSLISEGFRGIDFFYHTSNSTGHQLTCRYGGVADKILSLTDVSNCF